jgi:hypothetical protein
MSEIRNDELRAPQVSHDLVVNVLDVLVEVNSDVVIPQSCCTEGLMPQS